MDRKARILLTMAGLLFGTLPSLARATMYDVTILASTGFAFAINDAGVVAGSAEPNHTYPPQAAVWNAPAQGVLTNPGGTIGGAVLGINNTGDVAGYLLTAPYQGEAVVWHGGSPTVLGSIAGASSQANAINAAGQVAGTINTAGFQQAVVWNGTKPTILGSISGNQTSAAAINTAGQVVGYSGAETGSHQAVIWDGTTPTLLQSPGGTTSSEANGINDLGQVVGGVTFSSRSSSAVIWQGQSLTVLGSLGGSYADAKAINDIGQVVGDGGNSRHLQSGIVWSGATAIDVNNLLSSDPEGLFIESLDGINSLGQIIGFGLDSLGNEYPVLLTPTVPEASTWTLTILGFCALGYTVLLRNAKMASVTA